MVIACFEPGNQQYKSPKEDGTKSHDARTSVDP